MEYKGYGNIHRNAYGRDGEMQNAGARKAGSGHQRDRDREQSDRVSCRRNKDREQSDRVSCRRDKDSEIRQKEWEATPSSRRLGSRVEIATPRMKLKGKLNLCFV